jgi:hypothetical protein
VADACAVIVSTGMVVEVVMVVAVSVGVVVRKVSQDFVIVFVTVVFTVAVLCPAAFRPVAGMSSR